MIPPELKKPLDEIKTPSNRILLICLILAIVSLGTVIGYLWKGNDKNLKRELSQQEAENLALKDEVKRLTKYIFDKQEEDNQRLKKREAYMDSIINVTKSLNQTLK